jgi:Xaa-Pro aminopeptidase
MNIFARRRSKLGKLMDNNSLCIIESASEKTRNNDVFFPFRQESNFFYLTGYNEPHAILLVYKHNKKIYSHFFSKKPNKFDEIWTGKIMSSSQIKKIYEFDKCGYLDEVNKYMNTYLKDVVAVYHSLEDTSLTKKKLHDIIIKLDRKYRHGVKSPSKIFSLKKTLQSLRLIKDRTEIKNIKHACKISAHAHIHLMRECTPGISEKNLEAALSFIFKQNGCTDAYPSIVASGKNACTLHYTKNSSKLKNGDLLLTDAACEYLNYASDITRTIPVNGKFTQEQKLIYEIVLDAQIKAIKKCKINNTLLEIDNEAIKIISKGLIKIGLLKGPLKKIIKDGKYKKFYMHNTSHWLGLDVHDPCEYQINDKPIKLKEGMIFTVEPGIYIGSDKSIPKKYHNIGIRIEDDILITKKGPEVLTSLAPKNITNIEEIMKND